MGDALPLIHPMRFIFAQGIRFDSSPHSQLRIASLQPNPHARTSTRKRILLGVTSEASRAPRGKSGWSCTSIVQSRHQLLHRPTFKEIVEAVPTRDTLLHFHTGIELMRCRGMRCTYYIRSSSAHEVLNALLISDTPLPLQRFLKHLTIKKELLWSKN